MRKLLFLFFIGFVCFSFTSNAPPIESIEARMKTDTKKESLQASYLGNVQVNAQLSLQSMIHEKESESYITGEYDLVKVASSKQYVTQKRNAMAVLIKTRKVVATSELMSQVEMKWHSDCSGHKNGLLAGKTRVDFGSMNQFSTSNSCMLSLPNRTDMKNEGDFGSMNKFSTSSIANSTLNSKSDKA